MVFRKYGNYWVHGVYSDKKWFLMSRKFFLIVMKQFFVATRLFFSCNKKVSYFLKGLVSRKTNFLSLLFIKKKKILASGNIFYEWSLPVNSLTLSQFQLISSVYILTDDTTLHWAIALRALGGRLLFALAQIIDINVFNQIASPSKHFKLVATQSLVYRLW